MAAIFEGTASGLITNLASDLIILFKKKCSSTKGKKERLEEALLLIQSVLDAAKGRVIQNPSLKRWLIKLNKAALHGNEALTIAKRLLTREEKPKTSFSPLLSFANKFLMINGDSKKLDAALEALENACCNLQLFLKLLELDGTSKKAGISVRHLRSFELPLRIEGSNDSSFAVRGVKRKRVESFELRKSISNDVVRRKKIKVLEESAIIWMKIASPTN